MKIFEFAKKFIIPSSSNNYFPLLLEKKIVNSIFILLLILKIFTIPILFSISKSVFFADITKSAILTYLNLERKSRNLPVLVENEKLNQSAFLKAKDILEKDYFSHFSPEGLSPWHWFRLTGYHYQLAGENLAIGFLDSKEVHDAWMASPSHRQNILNKDYQEVGIAVLKGEFNGNEVYVVVEHFGKPKEKTLLEVQTSTQTQILEKETTTKESITSTVATQTQEISTPTQIASQEILPPKNQETTKKAEIKFSFLKFLSLKYQFLVNLIVYFLLALMFLSLTLTIFLDVIFYKKFMVDYKQLIPRWVSFCFVLFVLLYLDQTKLIKLIPHKFMIYGG